MKKLHYKHFRIHNLMVVFILSLISSHFGHAQQRIEGTLEFDNIERSYIVYVPKSYKPQKKVPLVLNFHGYTSDASQQEIYTSFNWLAEKKDFIVVYPQGTPDISGINHFNVDWPFTGTNVDDVGFTNALLDKLISEYAINEKRIYSTGFSNGGFLSYKLACELSDRIAAIASVGGSITVGQIANCNPSHPMPVLQIHGTNDETVPYDGNPIFEPVTTILDYWSNFNNTNSIPRTFRVPNFNFFDSSTVEFQQYRSGDNGVTVEHFRVDNGGHTWPGSIIPLPDLVTNYDIIATKLIWRFFSRFDIDGAIRRGYYKNPEDFENDLKNDLKDDLSNDAGAISVFPSPASDFVNITGNISKNTPYTLTSVQGKIVQKGTITPNQRTINLQELASGVYIFKTTEESLKIVKE